MAAKTYVLGASGFIGQHIFSNNKDISEEIVSVGRSNEENVYLDISKIDSARNLIDVVSPGDRVVFLAGYSSPEYCEKNVEVARLVNVANTKKLIEKFLDRNAYVLFASSDVVYGGGEVSVNELSSLNPCAAYADMKRNVETSFNSPFFKIMRLSFVWAHNDKFTLFAKHCSKEGKLLQVFHPFTRSIICIDDVVDFVSCFIKNPQALPVVTNLCGPEHLDRVDLLRLLAEHIPLEYVVSEAPKSYWKYRPRKILMESVYLERILKRPVRSLDEAIHNYFKQEGRV